MSWETGGQREPTDAATTTLTHGPAARAMLCDVTSSCAPSSSTWAPSFINISHARLTSVVEAQVIHGVGRSLCEVPRGGVVRSTGGLNLCERRVGVGRVRGWLHLPSPPP